MTQIHFSQIEIQREGLSKSFANIMSKELHELQVNLKEYKPEIKKLVTDVWSVISEG